MGPLLASDHTHLSRSAHGCPSFHADSSRQRMSVSFSFPFLHVIRVIVYRNALAKVGQSVPERSINRRK